MPMRQKLLIAALALVAAVFLFDSVYRNWYEQPLEQAENAIERLEEALHTKTLDVRRNENRLPELEELVPRSLPRRLEVAVTDYRSWLLRTIETSGLQPPNLDTNTAGSFRNLYNRLSFTVRSRGTLTQLTDFLHTFYTTDFLHKIRSLSLTPTSDGQLDISITIETLSVPLIATESTLPEPGLCKDHVADREAYHVIARRNIFRQGEPVAAKIRLSAVTTDRQDERRAWLRNDSTGETRIVSAGDELIVQGTHLAVESIQDEVIVIAVDGRLRRVELGDTLE